MSKVSITKENLEPDVRVVAGDALTHDEQIRCASLSLACRYYVETIVKDGDLYREMVRDNRVLKPATYMGVLEVAYAFREFISGDLDAVADAVTTKEKKSGRKSKKGSVADMEQDFSKVVEESQ